MAESPMRAKAAALCRKFPNTPNRTLARRLYNENKESFSNLEAARTLIRVIVGQKGKSRSAYVAPKHRVPKAAGKSGWVPECPPSIAEPWEPVVLPTPARVLSLSDVHVPFHDQRAVEAAVKHGKAFNPTVVLCNGDIADFFTISRFLKDPKKRNLKGELDTVKEFLSWIRGQFPRAKIYYKLGNHEERWNHWLWNHGPEICDLAEVQIAKLLDFERFRIIEVGDNPILAGRLPILHGHEFGKSGIAAPVNPARGAFLRTLHSCLVGHLHRTSTHCEPDMFKSETTTWSQGALCALSAEFARINKWNHGACCVEVARDGQFNVHNFRLNKDYTVRSA